MKIETRLHSKVNMQGTMSWFGREMLLSFDVGPDGLDAEPGNHDLNSDELFMRSGSEEDDFEICRRFRGDDGN